MLDSTARVNQGIRLPNGSRNHSGFTLVEALAVSVIVAALAAVAIPMYSGYVKNQREVTAKNIAQSTAAAANIYTRRTGAPPNCVDTPACIALLNLYLMDPEEYEIEIDKDDRTVTVRVPEYEITTSPIDF